MYNARHFLKKIRRNKQTEKKRKNGNSKSLERTNSESKMVRNIYGLSELNISKLGNDSLIKLTNLNYAVLYPIKIVFKEQKMKQF